jgi:hypothetical protein
VDSSESEEDDNVEDRFGFLGCASVISMLSPPRPPSSVKLDDEHSSLKNDCCDGDNENELEVLINGSDESRRFFDDRVGGFSTAAGVMIAILLVLLGISFFFLFFLIITAPTSTI